MVPQEDSMLVFTLFWHGLGIACLVAIPCLVLGVISQLRGKGWKAVVVTLLAGLICTVGALAILLSDIFIPALSFYSDWLMDISFRARVCLGVTILVLVPIALGHIIAKPLRKYCPPLPIIYCGLIIPLLLVAQPIVMGWLRVAGLLPPM